MLYTQIKQLYEHFRLEHYRELFGRIREKDGSLSATEAYAADVIYLLGNPTVSTFAEVLGISQPNATYKINNLASKGYVSRSASDEDRRECRVSVGERFYSYYNTDYPFIAHGLEKLEQSYTPEQLALFEKMLGDLNQSLE
jgi:DNA-binding MarR family transcriptional regulator